MIGTEGGIMSEAGQWYPGLYSPSKKIIAKYKTM